VRSGAARPLPGFTNDDATTPRKDSCPLPLAHRARVECLERPLGTPARPPARRVSPGGFEKRTTSGENAVDRHERGGGSERLATVRDYVGTDPDDALRIAIKAAVDAGDLARATRLIEVLGASAPSGAIIELGLRRRS
jgi:hypothetical protein